VPETEFIHFNIMLYTALINIILLAANETSFMKIFFASHYMPEVIYVRLQAEDLRPLV